MSWNLYLLSLLFWADNAILNWQSMNCNFNALMTAICYPLQAFWNRLISSYWCILCSCYVGVILTHFLLPHFCADLIRLSLFPVHVCSSLFCVQTWNKLLFMNFGFNCFVQQSSKTSCQCLTKMFTKHRNQSYWDWLPFKFEWNTSFTIGHRGTVDPLP